jgi:hypothetical protein
MAKLRPVLILAGVAGIVTAVRKRAGGEQIQQAASDLASRAKDAAPEPVKQAVDKVTGSDEGNDGAREETRRYAAPAEAGSQPPTEAGGPPSDDPQATVARSIASDPADSLHTKSHDLPADVAMPDVSNDDPLVREAEAAAAADAGSIGGNVDEMAQDEPGFPEDPARRPVVEGSGDADEQTTEEADRELGGNRETRP